MPFLRGSLSRLFIFALILNCLGLCAYAAQTVGNTGSISGTVTDGSGALVQGAQVTILNPVTGVTRTAITDQSGKYQFINLPFNPYHLSIAIPGFDPYSRDVDVRTSVAIVLTDTVKVGTSVTTVTVDAGDLLENDTGMHTDVDRSSFEKIPLESVSSATRTARCTDWETTLPTRFRSMARISPTSRVRFSATNFLRIPSSRWK